MKKIEIKRWPLREKTIELGKAVYKIIGEVIQSKFGASTVYEITDLTAEDVSQPNEIQGGGEGEQAKLIISELTKGEARTRIIVVLKGKGIVADIEKVQKAMLKTNMYLRRSIGGLNYNEEYVKKAVQNYIDMEK